MDTTENNYPTMDIELVKEPVYQQLSKALKSMITTGEFKIGSKFLTERIVSERFKVSRTTANKALANLTAEGILEYKQGRGTFIKGATLTHELGLFMSSTNRIQDAGLEPSTKVLFFKEMDTRSMSKEVNKLFPLDDGEKIYYFKRLKFANGIPVMLEKHYFRAKYMSNLTRQKVSESLYSVITNEYKLTLIGYDEYIQSDLVKGRDAELLDVPEGTAGFIIYNIGYLLGEIPLYCSIEMSSHHVYEFHNHLRLDKTQRPIGKVIKQF